MGRHPLAATRAMARCSPSTPMVLALRPSIVSRQLIRRISTNSDGAGPVAPLILSGTTLYGTASAGGTDRSGTVFKVNTDGTGFTTLHNFIAVSDGAGPGQLILSGNTLFGTTGEEVGTNGGTLFAVNTDG